MNKNEKLPNINIPISTRYWVSNVFGGTLRTQVLEMYRNLPELARMLKDTLVLKLQAIIAHGEFKLCFEVIG